VFQVLSQRIYFLTPLEKFGYNHSLAVFTKIKEFPFIFPLPQYCPRPEFGRKGKKDEKYIKE
jgi:hypothetical protein